MTAIDPDKRASIASEHGVAHAAQFDWGDDSLAGRALAAMKREPVLFVTFGYLALSVLGLWSSWWFYRGFDFNILQYMQGGDFLVAGVRQPMYAFVLLVAIGYALLFTWPDRWRRRHPDRYARIAGRWWAKVAFPKRHGWWAMRLRPDTMAAVLVIGMMLGGSAAFAWGSGQAVREGRGRSVDRVRLHMAGQAAPTADVRLLGTTQVFLLVYWPQTQRVDAVPIEAVARVETRERVRARNGLRQRLLGR